MEKSSRRWIRFTVYTVEIILFFIVQQTPIPKFDSYAINPNIVLTIAVSIAFFESDVVSMCFGLLVGILMDFGAGVPLCVNTVLFAVLCFFIGFLTSNVIRTNILNVLWTAVIVIVFSYGMHFLFFYLMKGYDQIEYVLFHNYGPRMLVTFILVPVFYLFNKSIMLLTHEKE